MFSVVLICMDNASGDASGNRLLLAAEQDANSSRGTSRLVSRRESARNRRQTSANESNGLAAILSLQSEVPRRRSLTDAIGPMRTRGGTPRSLRRRDPGSAGPVARTRPSIAPRPWGKKSRKPPGTRPKARARE
jgi:hypothetical protein